MSETQQAKSDFYLCLINLTKTFGSLVAVNNVSLDIAEGEFICLLGPSGCGKTTILRMIAGLEQQNAGQIFQAGKDISRLPTRDRDFGIVFQSYALFPNLNVKQNIAYGLENRKLPKKEIEDRVVNLLEMISLPDVSNKYPAQLSGGQQQRIALARALATSPGLLLLDEPLSALDARVRMSLRLEIKHLQRRLGVTTVFVTHDQEEALVMADRIIVMRNGSIEQAGLPEDIYRKPATPFVADFVGVMNFLPGKAGQDARYVQCGSLDFYIDEPHAVPIGSPVTVAIRPEDVRVGETNLGNDNTAQAKIDEAEFLGSFYRLTLTVEGMPATRLIAEVSNNIMRDQALQQGNRVPIYLPASLLRVYSGDLGFKR
jgi:iron(III) transport system ATP-binding protein